MAKLKQMLAAVGCLVCLLTAGCGREQSQKAPTQPVERENSAKLYNEAVEKLLQAQSYTMVGSVNSSSVMGEVLTSVVTSVDCKYAAREESYVMRMEAMQRYDGLEFAHSTYYADGKYYYDTLGTKYIKTENDLGDFAAADYAMLVEDSALTNYTIQQTHDGEQQVRFEIPYGIFYSDALDYWLGDFMGEDVRQRLVVVRATIDADGFLTGLYIDVENETSFTDEPVLQTVTISLKFSGYNETQVTAPTDLDAYEDQTQEYSGGQHGGDDDVPEEFTGDSLD